MTETEWERGTDPDPMLKYVRGKASDRKMRLFAAACFRRLAALLPDPRQRRGIEVLERMAEGTVSRAGCRGVTMEVRRAIPPNDWVTGMPPADDPHFVALMLYREFCSSSIAVHALPAAAGLADGAAEQHEQARLMRCVFGSPFRDVAVDPSWLAWNEGTAARLAQAIYDDRAIDRLPELADALEDAGCTNSDVLAHCRGRGPHVRGCWVVDLMLGKS